MAKKISVLFAAAECAPFAKVGGLADVVGSLPQALCKMGVTVAVILPKYGSVSKKIRMKKIKTIQLDYGRHKYTVTVYHTHLPKNPVDYYFIDHAYFRGKYIYNYKRKSGSHTITDIDRFALFSESVVEAVNQIPLSTDIIHCHDWQTGLVPTSVDQLAVKKEYPFTKTVYTIHNIAYQGKTPRSILNKLDMKELATPYLLEDYYDHDHKRINFMKLGILSADKINTVSPSYAKEVLTSKQGRGLETFLIRRKKDVSGILNGIDIKKFDPSKDKKIYKTYTTKSWKRNKAINKQRLQKEVGLPVKDVPLYGIVTRVVNQKGLDILEKALKRFATHDIQFVLLGTGITKIERAYINLQKKYPNKIVSIIDFDVTLAKKIYAGSDFFLMPSKFEPCGLGQMISMRYGTIPIVRATGGLKDTVLHGKTGIVFGPATASALYQALLQSENVYSSKKTWYTMVSTCMKKDFSWEASAKVYKKLYQSLV